MMTRDTAGIRERIQSLVEQSPSYVDIYLVAHGGEIVASARGSAGDTLTQDARPCNFCHSLADLSSSLSIRSHDELVVLEGGDRVVSVITPVLNQPTCGSPTCHAYDESNPVLGLLQVDFSLALVDARISKRNVQTLLAIILAVSLSAIAVFLLTGRLLGRPIRTLATGMRRIADEDFSFRFQVDRNDEFASLATTFSDMSSRLATSLSELRDTRDYLEGIIENSADIIITVNPDGLIETFNSGAEGTLGYSREEVIGQRIEMLFADPREREVAIGQLQHTDNVVNYETHFRTKDGEVRDVILTLSRLRDPDGQAVGTFGISKDVSQEKSLQRQLILSERFAAVGQALIGIQHAMKNMLNRMMGGAYMVRTGLGKDDRELIQDGWALVQEGIDHLTAMSSHFLDYVKVWRPELEWTDLSELVEGAVRSFEQADEGSEVDLRTQLSHGVPAVFCDPRMIRSAVADLLSNALDACRNREYESGETPAIEVCVVSPEGESHLLVEIRDNGCGMSEKVKSSVFAPFFSTKKKGGSGLGLALTSRAIGVHGGTVEVESATGQGSTFRITLPIDGPRRAKEETDGQEGTSH
jgi:PAS domain S-box-containing protein